VENRYLVSCDIVESWAALRVPDIPFHLHVRFKCELIRKVLFFGHVGSEVGTIREIRYLT
jgi:hypothetical protein